MPSLSVIMIVKDEAHTLADCLRSVADIADEIVVLDTGSTDDTPAVAASLGARVEHIPWENDFARARNASIARASGDWLLHLDADEVLDPSGANEVRAIVDTDRDSAAVEVTLANYCNDPRAWRWVASPADSPFSRGYAGYLPVGLLRLFRKQPGIAYREPVHESITASVRELGGAIRASDILIHHYGYEGTPARRLEKARMYLRLAREQVRANPADVKSLHDLAEQALACGEEDEAESACLQAIALDPAHVASVTTLANIYLNRGETEPAQELLLGIEQDGQSLPHVQTALGAIALHHGDWTGAEARLAAVRRAHPPAPVATLYLARALDYRGEGDAALSLLRELAEETPALEEPRRRIRGLELRWAGEQAFASGDTEGGLRYFLDALREDGEDAITHNNAGVALHALGERDRARDCFTRALQLAPGLTEARQNLEEC